MIGAIALVLSPVVLVLALSSLYYALVASVGILVAAASATLIQLWFRKQAKRSQFRRRQTSSRVATFAEAFSSISWAATAGLAAAGTWVALAPGADRLRASSPAPARFARAEPPQLGVAERTQRPQITRSDASRQRLSLPPLNAFDKQAPLDAESSHDFLWG